MPRPDHALERDTPRRSEGDPVCLYPSQGYANAVDAVARLVATAKPTASGDALVARFIGKRTHG